MQLKFELIYNNTKWTIEKKILVTAAILERKAVGTKSNNTW